MSKFSKISLLWLINFALVVGVLFAIGARPHKVENQKHNLANVERFSAFLEPIVNRANNPGVVYRPNDLLRDEKSILLKYRAMGKPNLSLGQGGISIDEVINQLREAMRRSYIRCANKDRFDHERNFEGKTFDDWKVKNGFSERTEFVKTLSKMGWAGVLGWFIRFYLYCIPLSMLLYVRRSIARDGNLEIILGNKTRFLIASTAWLFGYIVRYPHNVLRELWVEAQLRRLGDVYRRLGSDERKLVREVASSASYGQWISDFKRDNVEWFQNKFVWALLITIVFGLVLPAFSQNNARAKAPPRQSVVYERIDYGNGLGRASGVDHSQTDHGGTGEYTLPVPYRFTRPDKFWWTVSVTPSKPRDAMRAVDHVPLRQSVLQSIAN